MTSPSSPGFFASRIRKGTYFVPEIEDASSRGLEVVCAGWEDCSNDYLLTREGFPYYAIEYIVSGEWILETSGGKRKLGPGAVFCYGPNVAYKLAASTGTSFGKYFIDFVGEQAEEKLALIDLNPGSDGIVQQHRWLRDLFDQLIEARQFNQSSQRNLARLTLELILARLPEHLGVTEQKSQAWLTFERCRSYLSDNYLSVQSLADAAVECGVAPAYLSRLFNRFANESPKGFVDRLKMNHAAQKLVRGNVLVKVAAAEVGYFDVFHFSRVFKKCFGVSPSGFVNRAAERNQSTRWK